jgi:hypothetical protein
MKRVSLLGNVLAGRKVVAFPVVIYDLWAGHFVPTLLMWRFQECFLLVLWLELWPRKWYWFWGWSYWFVSDIYRCSCDFPWMVTVGVYNQKIPE